MRARYTQFRSSTNHGTRTEAVETAGLTTLPVSRVLIDFPQRLPERVRREVLSSWKRLRDVLREELSGDATERG
jgi:hypothetical protein